MDRQSHLVANGQAAALADLLQPVIEGLGFELIRLSMGSGQRTSTLQIMAERPDWSIMLVEDCTTLSRALSAVLDEKDPVAGEYLLEVSSPGIDRPLTRLKDFERWAGFEVRLETATPLDGQKRFHAKLLGIEDDTVWLAGEQDEIRLAFADIAKARLVLTDDLLAATKACCLDIKED